MPFLPETEEQRTKRFQTRRASLAPTPEERFGIQQLAGGAPRVAGDVTTQLGPKPFATNQTGGFKGDLPSTESIVEKGKRLGFATRPGMLQSQVRAEERAQLALDERRKTLGLTTETGDRQRQADVAGLVAPAITTGAAKLGTEDITQAGEQVTEGIKSEQARLGRENIAEATLASQERAAKEKRAEEAGKLEREKARTEREKSIEAMRTDRAKNIKKMEIDAEKLRETATRTAEEKKTQQKAMVDFYDAVSEIGSDTFTLATVAGALSRSGLSEEAQTRLLDYVGSASTGDIKLSIPELRSLLKNPTKTEG